MSENLYQTVLIQSGDAGADTYVPVPKKAILRGATVHHKGTLSAEETVIFVHNATTVATATFPAASVITDTIAAVRNATAASADLVFDPASSTDAENYVKITTSDNGSTVVEWVVVLEWDINAVPARTTDGAATRP